MEGGRAIVAREVEFSLALVSGMKDILIENCRVRSFHAVGASDA